LGTAAPILEPEPAAGIIAAITFLSVSGTFTSSRKETEKKGGL